MCRPWGCRLLLRCPGGGDTPPGPAWAPRCPRPLRHPAQQAWWQGRGDTATGGHGLTGDVGTWVAKGTGGCRHTWQCSMAWGGHGQGYGDGRDGDMGMHSRGDTGDGDMGTWEGQTWGHGDGLTGGRGNTVGQDTGEQGMGTQRGPTGTWRGPGQTKADPGSCRRGQGCPQHQCHPPPLLQHPRLCRLRLLSGGRGAGV